MPKAFAAYDNQVLRLDFTSEEALGLTTLVGEMQPEVHRGQLKDLVQWLQGSLPSVVSGLRTELDPNPPAVEAKETNAVEQDERRTGGKRGGLPDGS